jgi:hypothetical protein
MIEHAVGLSGHVHAVLPVKHVRMAGRIGAAIDDEAGGGGKGKECRSRHQRGRLLSASNPEERVLPSLTGFQA